MNTEKIQVLCRLSDRYYNGSRAFEKIVPSEAKGLKISFSYQTIELDFDDYPELKPLIEKLCDYLVKSEKSKQDEIKLEIVKALGNDKR